MNILTDKLPCCVEVDGTEYPVRTSFRDWICFFEMLDDEELTDVQRFFAAMSWYTEKKPENAEDAFDALISFALCKDIPQAGKHNKSEEETDKSAAPPVFSWLYDAPFVLGAFMQAYGIDLAESDMHWYRFFALFQSLPEETLLKKRIALRQTNTADIKDKSQRIRIRKAQNMIAIPFKALDAGEVGAVFG